jgi:hypothetical protein
VTDQCAVMPQAIAEAMGFNAEMGAVPPGSVRKSRPQAARSLVDRMACGILPIRRLTR